MSFSRTVEREQVLRTVFREVEGEVFWMAVGKYRIEVAAFILSVAYFLTRYKSQIERVSTQDVGVSSAF